MNAASTPSPRFPHTNRRRHARVAARGVASHIQAMDANMPGLAVENLSPGGMFVRCAAALAVGTPVMVTLVRPGLKRAIPMQGHVVSVITPTAARELGAIAGMGLRLDPVDIDAELRFGELVEQLAEATPGGARSAAPEGATEARDRILQDLEDEVQTLRRELLRRNRTIGDLATRLAAYETARKPGTLRRADPRAD